MHNGLCINLGGGVGRQGLGNSFADQANMAAQVWNGRFGVLVMDEDKGSAQGNPRFVLHARMALEEKAEELFSFKLAQTPHVFFMERPHRLKLAREQHLVEMID